MLPQPRSLYSPSIKKSIPVWITAWAWFSWHFWPQVYTLAVLCDRRSSPECQHPCLSTIGESLMILTAACMERGQLCENRQMAQYVEKKAARMWKLATKPNAVWFWSELCMDPHTHTATHSHSEDSPMEIFTFWTKFMRNNSLTSFTGILVQTMINHNSAFLRHWWKNPKPIHQKHAHYIVRLLSFHSQLPEVQEGSAGSYFIHQVTREREKTRLWIMEIEIESFQNMWNSEPPSINCPYCLSIKGCGVAGADPSWLHAWGRILPEQAANLSQSWHRDKQQFTFTPTV